MTNWLSGWAYRKKHNISANSVSLSCTDKQNVTVTADYYEAFPSMIEAANGNILLAYRKGTVHMGQNDGYCVMKVSEDDGETWGNEVTLYDDPTYDVRDPQLHLCPNGHILLFITLSDLANDTHLGMKIYRSTDNGANWSYLAEFPNDGTNRSVGFSAHLINVGSIIYGISGSLTNNGNWVTGLWNNVLWKSEDNGVNWTKVSQPNGTSEHCDEPTIAWISSESRFIIVSRDTQSTHAWYKKSTDSTGENWGSQTDISSQVGIIQDPELTWFGDLLLLCGRNPTNTQTVCYRSINNGTTFGNGIVVDDYGTEGGGVHGGYASTIALSDSLALISFYTNTINPTEPDIQRSKFNISYETNYQVKITVHQGSGSDSGENVYCNDHCLDDFGDIRVTDDDGSTLLDYWIESKTDGSEAIIWIELPQLAFSVAIYLYYGKSDATTLSNGADTFIFFDHFDEGSINTDRWTVDADVTTGQSGSIITISRGATSAWRGILGKTSMTYGRWKSRGKLPDITHYEYLAFGENNDPNSGSHHAGFIWRADNDPSYYSVYNNIPSGYYLAAISGGGDTNYHLYEILWKSGLVSYFIDGNAKNTDTTKVPSNACYALAEAHANGSVLMDWIFLSKYSDPEPSHGTWESEELPALPTSKIFAVDKSNNLFRIDPLTLSEEKALSIT